MMLLSKKWDEDMRRPHTQSVCTSDMIFQHGCRDTCLHFAQPSFAAPDELCEAPL